MVNADHAALLGFVIAGCVSAFHPGTQAPTSQLRGLVAVYDVTPTSRKVLYQGVLVPCDGRPKPCPPLDTNPDDEPVLSEYSISSSHDVVIHLSHGVKEIGGGQISIRARTLASPPVEIPVENYTTINDKELKEEKKLLLASDTDFFRDPANQALLQHLGELQQAASEYTIYLDSTGLSAVNKAYGQGPVKDWLSKGIDAQALRSSQPNKIDVSDLVAGLKQASSDEGDHKKKVLDAIAALQQDINVLFVNSRLAAQLNDSELGRVRTVAQQLNVMLGSWRARLTTAKLDASRFDACTSARFYVHVAKGLQVTDPSGAKISIRAGEELLVVAGSAPRIVYPPPFEGLPIDLKASGLEVSAKGNNDTQCYSSVIPGFWEPFRSLLQTLGEITTATDATASVAKSPECPTSGTAAPQAQSMQFYPAIDEMRLLIKCGVESKLMQTLRDARIRLAPLHLDHGDRIEIIVRVTLPAVTLKADADGAGTDVEERFVLRAVDDAFEFRASPQFALVKRMSDVHVATATEVPSNFKPAAGAVFSFRWRGFWRWTDWVTPSLGLAAHVVDFDPRTNFELGLGPSLGLLDDHVHAGVGWNISVDDHRAYWWISLDFLKAFSTFGTIFGGG